VQVNDRRDVVGEVRTRQVHPLARRIGCHAHEARIDAGRGEEPRELAPVLDLARRHAQPRDFAALDQDLAALVLYGAARRRESRGGEVLAPPDPRPVRPTHELLVPRLGHESHGEEHE
jgi:hypothetical protein